MDARKLLEYYYNLILYRPSYPKNSRQDLVVTDLKQYVPYESIFGGESRFGYELFLGKASIEEITESLDEREENPGSDTYLCSILVDKRGYYQQNSFYLNPILFAFGKMLKEKNLRTDLDLNLLNKANEEFNEFLLGFGRKLEYRELKEVFNYVVNKLNLSSFIEAFSCLVREYDPTTLSKSQGTLMDLEEMLMKRDTLTALSDVANHFEEIKPRFTGLNHCDGLDRLKEAASAKATPLIKWPGQENRDLKDQILTAKLSGDEKPISYYPCILGEKEEIYFTKSLLAQKQLDLALAMMKYDHPDEAFVPTDFETNKDYSSSYYVPSQELKDGLMVILDQKEGIANSLFKEMTSDFAKIMPYPFYTVNEEPYVLEKFNDNKDMVRFIKEMNGKGGLLETLREDHLDFTLERENFRKIYDRARRKRDEIAGQEELTLAYPQALEKVSAQDMVRLELMERRDLALTEAEEKQKELRTLELALVAKEEEHEKISSQISFFKRAFHFLFKKDEQILARRQNEKEQQELNKQIEGAQEAYEAKNLAHRSLETEAQEAQETYRQEKRRVEDMARNIASYKASYGDGFANGENIQELFAKDLEGHCPLWQNQEMEELRTELFIAALKLKRAFVASSRAMKTNLSLLMLVLDGSLSGDDFTKAYPALWQSLQILVPAMVIDLDYAPFLLSQFGKDSLTMALVPQARAIPMEEASGILWRFAKVTAFNGGRDHWYTPRVPNLVARNLSDKILMLKDPEKLDFSFAEGLNLI